MKEDGALWEAFQYLRKRETHSPIKGSLKSAEYQSTQHEQRFFRKRPGSRQRPGVQIAAGPRYSPSEGPEV